MNNIYKRMIHDSPIAYIYVKGIENEYGEYDTIKIIDANKSFERLFNIKLEDIVDSTIDKYVLKDLELWNVALSNSEENDKYIVKRYIEEYNLYLNIDIYNLGNGEFTARFTEIEEGFMKLSTMLRDCPFYTWIKDRSGKYVDINKSLLEMANKSYDEAIGKTDYELWTKSMADECVTQDMEVITNNKLCTYESVMYIDGHTKRYLEITKWPYKDQDNNILGSIGVAIDVTERMELRKSIERNEQNFLDISSNIENVFIIMDREKATYISPSFEKVFEESPDRLYDDINRWREYYKEEDLENLEPIKFDEASDMTIRLKNSKEKEKWLWSKFVPIKNEHGDTIKKIGIISDITKKKELEKELDKLRMDFFANLSHELRTPINLILSTLQVLDLKMSKLDQENLDYFNKYLGIIGQNGFRLLKLVNNLIDTTKIDSGNFSHNPKNHDIVSFVEDICMSVSEFVEINDMDIIFDTDIEEKIVSFDLDNMERIVLNLISNAIKFNKPKGKIEVYLSCDDDIKISIKDTGIGIPADKINSVFGRFEQVKSKMKNEKEGSGIGLSLVKSLVEMHSGKITLNSKIDEGSEFIITLPDIVAEGIDDSLSEKIGFTKYVSRMNVEFSDIYA